MYYPIMNKLNLDFISYGKTPFTRLKEKIISMYSGYPGVDKELAIMMNEMEVDFPINQRAWKRHSALIVYSRYQNIK